MRFRSKRLVFNSIAERLYHKNLVLALKNADFFTSMLHFDKSVFRSFVEVRIYYNIRNYGMK